MQDFNYTAFHYIARPACLARVRNIQPEKHEKLSCHSDVQHQRCPHHHTPLIVFMAAAWPPMPGCFPSQMVAISAQISISKDIGLWHWVLFGLSIHSSEVLPDQISCRSYT